MSSIRGCGGAVPISFLSTHMVTPLLDAHTSSFHTRTSSIDTHLRVYPELIMLNLVEVFLDFLQNLRGKYRVLMGSYLETLTF